MKTRWLGILIVVCALQFVTGCATTPDNPLLGKWYSDQNGGLGIWFQENNRVITANKQNWNSALSLMDLYAVDLNAKPSTIEMKDEDGEFQLKGFIEIVDANTLRLSLDQDQRPSAPGQGKTAVFKRVQP